MHAHHMMQDGSSVLLVTIKGAQKLVRLGDDKHGHTELKAFGKIPTRKLVGLPYGLAFELVDNSTIRVLSREEVLALRGAAESAEENGANNREIVDAGTAQRLSQEDIEVMKQRVLKGDMAARELVTSVAQSNAVFVTRTEFSQQKYLDRKTRKYVRIFYALRPTPRQICEYYGAKNPSKIMDLRPDALGMLMTRANVHPGCRVLVVESACGLVAGTVLARLNGRGALVHFHEHLDPSVDVLSHMNLTDSQLASYHALPLANLHAMPSHEEYLTKLKATKLQARKVAITKRQEGLRAAKELMQLESFDAIIIASRFTPLSVVDLVLPYLNHSRPIVIYNPQLGPLFQCYTAFRESKAMINVLMAESFSRVYQVLPMRTHPENNMNGLAGFVLSATKVDPVAPVLAVAEKVLVAADPVAADEGGDVPENTAVEGGDVVDCDVKNRA